jgi:DNA-binding MurR/RpiR family transcriptional regulator
MKYRFHDLHNSEIRISHESATQDGGMAQTRQDSLTQRVHRLYGDLPEGERKAADFILEQPGELAMLAAGELADRVGISKATVSRFFRRLGYASFEEARRAARAMRASGSPLYLAEVTPAPRQVSVISAAMAAENRVVDGSLALQNPLTLEAVTRALAAARRVVVAGFRNSHFAAAYFASTLAQLRPNVVLLNAAGQTLGEGLADLGPGDVIVVVALRRRPAGFAEMIRAFAATGADVVLLADRSIREAPAFARWTLTCLVEMPQLLDSYAGALAVLRLVALETMRRLGADARRRLEIIEARHEALSELE